MNETVLIFIIGGVIAFLLIYIPEWESRNFLKRVAKSLEGEVIGSVLGHFFLKISNYKEEMRIEIIKKEGYRFTYRRFLWISWRHPLDCTLTITPHSFGDILSRPFARWDKEADKINFPDSDDKYSIKSKEPQITTMLLQDTERQEAIEGLFNNGFLFIEADNKSINIKKPFKKEDLDAEQLRSYFDALNKFALGSSGVKEGIKNEKICYEKYPEKRYNFRKLIMYRKIFFIKILLLLIFIVSIPIYRIYQTKSISRRREEYHQKMKSAGDKLSDAVKKAAKDNPNGLLEIYEIAANDSTYTVEMSEGAWIVLIYFLRQKTEFWISVFSEVDQGKFKTFLREKALDLSMFRESTDKFEENKQETVKNLKKIKGNEKETELIDYILKLIEENE